MESKMNPKIKRLEREDVVSVYSGQILVNNRTFTLNEFLAAMLTIMKAQSGWTDEKSNWFGEGIDCKILQPGAKSWQRGKVRITLEFCPEGVEVTETSTSDGAQTNKTSSPLDDIRHMVT